MLSKIPVLRAFGSPRREPPGDSSTEAALQEAHDSVSDPAALARALEKCSRLLEAHTTPVASAKTLKGIAKSEGAQYREASPWPHIVIEHLLHPGILRRVVEEFSRMDRSHWTHTATAQSRERFTEDESAFGPFTRRVFATLNSGSFVGFLERLTAIDGLIVDPHLAGGGLLEIERGGLLGVHAESARSERLHVWRRLGLVIYLNLEWDEAWGGHLELWDAGGTTCMKRIAPIFGRAVIFDASSRSCHGYPHPLNCPEGQSCKSLSLYYYSAGAADAPDQEARGDAVASDFPAPPV